MDIGVGNRYQSLILIAGSKDERKKLQEIVNQLRVADESRNQIKPTRSLSTVIPGQLYHVQSAEESVF